MSEREDLIGRLYASALKRPIGERAAFVVERAGRDEDLRRRVEALLKGQQDTELPGHDKAGGAMLASGTPIGTYRIDGPLGAGGMGIVYRATDTKLNRPAAIKVLPDNLADPEARRRFQREAQMVSSLNHPHIVTVYDAGEYRDRQYLITEYVDGGTLRQWAARPRGWQQIVELLIGVADGIAVAHEAGILHRDIKPENILLAKNGYAKLADFGLAKLLETDPLADDVLAAIKPGDNSTLIGTAAYMSPEQMQGRALDGRSDVYAFGLVLHELLSGDRPVAGGDPRASAVRPLGEEVPGPLRAIVAKALEPEPADRYQTMRDLVVDLRRLVRRSELDDVATSGGLDAIATGSGAVTARVRAVRRRRIVYAAAAIASVAAVLLLTFYRGGFGGADTSTAVAVLPFGNETGDPDAAHLSDGLGDALRERLMELPLNVQARASSVSFRGQDTDARTIAKKLGVAVLINGTLLRREPLEVSVEVLNDRGFAVRPALKFEGAEHDLQALNQRIAAEVGALLVPSARASLAAPRPPPTPQSEDANLSVRFGDRIFREVKDQNTVDKEKLDRAIENYRRAIQAEPESIAAHSHLASALLYKGDIGGATAELETAMNLGQSLDASSKSVELSDVYYTVGLYLFSARRSRGEFYEKAIDLNPNNVDALTAYAQWLLGHRRAPEADALFREAIRLDRQSISRYENYALYLSTTDEIEKLHELASDIEARFSDERGFRALARLYEQAGELDVGIAYALKSLRQQPEDEETKAQLAELYVRIGDFDAADKYEPEPGVGQLWLRRKYRDLIDVAEEALQLDEPGIAEPALYYFLAFAYNATRQSEEARNLLEKYMGMPQLSSDDYAGPTEPQAAASYVDALQALERDEDSAMRLAQQRADELTAAIQNGTESSWWENTLLACAQAQLGKRAEALDTLERVVRSHGLVWSPLLEDSPCFKRGLADEPRFAAVIQRVEQRKKELRDRLPATLSRYDVADVPPAGP